MSERPKQLVFEWKQRPALAAEDFLVSPANSSAVALVDSWPDWPHSAALVQGPDHSGKSHLANVWRLRSGAELVAASAISDDTMRLFMATRAMVIEDIDRGIAAETALFHLLNAAREHRGSLLLTSRLAPGALEIGLPDLRSRLRALPVTAIGLPDETLLQALLVKLFADRQIPVSPGVVHAIVRNMDRSMAEANRIVDELDRQSLARRRPITRALAMEVVGVVGNGSDE